jgi:hypothetical protein
MTAKDVAATFESAGKEAKELAVAHDRPLAQGLLPAAVAGIALLFLKECLLDLVVDTREPLLGSRGAIAIMRRIGLGFPQPFLRGAQPERQPVRHVLGAGGSSFAMSAAFWSRAMIERPESSATTFASGCAFGVGAKGTIVAGLSGAFIASHSVTVRPGTDPSTRAVPRSYHSCFARLAKNLRWDDEAVSAVAELSRVIHHGIDRRAMRDFG